MATIKLPGNTPGMTLKAGDVLDLNGFTVTSQITVAGSDVTIHGPGRIKVNPGLKQKGIRLWNSNSDKAAANNVTIRDLEISSDSINAVGERGIEALWGIRTLTVRNVVIKNIMVPMILRSNNGVLIEYTDFGPNNVTDSGQHCEAISDNDSDNVTIRYCMFRDIMNSGIIVSGNGWSSSGGVAENWHIHNNVFYYTGQGPAWGVGNGIVACYNGQPAINWNVHNNTAINMQGWQAGVVLLNPQGCTVEDNLWYLLGKDPDGGPTALIQMDQLWTAANPFKDWRGGDFTVIYPSITGEGAQWPFPATTMPTPEPEPEPEPTPTPEPEPEPQPEPSPTGIEWLYVLDKDRQELGRVEDVVLPPGDYMIEARMWPGTVVNTVDFYVDGEYVNTERSAPYFMGGDYVLNIFSDFDEYTITAELNGTESHTETLTIQQPNPSPSPDLAAQLAEALDQIGELTEKVAGLESEKSALLTANDKLTAANAELQESVDVTQARLDSTIDNYNRLKNDIANLDTENSALKAKLSTALDRARELVGGLE